MNLDAIETVVNSIQSKAEQEYANYFSVASDGQEVLNTDLEVYNKNAGVSQIVTEFGNFLRENNGNARDIILKYFEYVKRFETIGLSADDIVNGTNQELDANSIRTTIESILNRAEEERTKMFQVASDGKKILRSDIATYEALISSLKIARENDELRQKNEGLQSEYTRLNGMLHNLNDTAKSVENTAPVQDISTAPEPAASGEIEPDRSIPIINPDEQEVVVDNPLYGKVRPDIVQDLPIHDTTASQEFNTPGMTGEQIKESQDNISEIDPLEAEINARFAEAYADDPERGKILDAGRRRANEAQMYEQAAYDKVMAEKEKMDFYPEGEVPDQDERIQEFLNMRNNHGTSSQGQPENPSPEVPVQEKAQTKRSEKSKKVTKREKFSWANKAKKNVARLKGILFKECLKGHSDDYKRLNQWIANFRVNYKNASAENNNNGLASLDALISKSNQLSFQEKKRLYRKLEKLSKAVEKLNSKKQASVESLEDATRTR